VSDKDNTAPSPPLGDVAKRGGYQGTHDPGRPANLMQPQINPTGQAGEQAGGSEGSQGAPDQGGSAGGAAQDSASN
jgi:hypothetical protein